MQNNTHTPSPRSSERPIPSIHMVYWCGSSGDLEPLPDLAERLNALGFIPRKGDTIDTDEDRHHVEDVVLNLSTDPDLDPFGTVSVILG